MRNILDRRRPEASSPTASSDDNFIVKHTQPNHHDRRAYKALQRKAIRKALKAQVRDAKRAVDKLQAAAPSLDAIRASMAADQAKGAAHKPPPQPQLRVVEDRLEVYGDGVDAVVLARVGDVVGDGKTLDLADLEHLASDGALAFSDQPADVPKVQVDAPVCSPALTAEFAEYEALPPPQPQARVVVDGVPLAQRDTLDFLDTPVDVPGTIKCPGFPLGDGHYSGCDPTAGSDDCPSCNGTGRWELPPRMFWPWVGARIEGRNPDNPKEILRCTVREVLLGGRPTDPCAGPLFPVKAFDVGGMAGAVLLSEGPDLYSGEVARIDGVLVDLDAVCPPGLDLVQTMHFPAGERLPDGRTLAFACLWGEFTVSDADLWARIDAPYRAAGFGCGNDTITYTAKDVETWRNMPKEKALASLRVSGPIGTDSGDEVVAEGCDWSGLPGYTPDDVADIAKHEGRTDAEWAALDPAMLSEEDKAERRKARSRLRAAASRARLKEDADAARDRDKAAIATRRVELSKEQEP